MEPVLRYRGRAIQLDDVAFIRALIAARPKASRRKLSIELCRAWGWVQSNGALRDAVCRGLLLALYRGGHIELPAAKYNSIAAWRRREPVSVTIDMTPIESSLAAEGSPRLRFWTSGVDDGGPRGISASGGLFSGHHAHSLDVRLPP